jgi:hypothetical protein
MNSSEILQNREKEHQYGGGGGGGSSGSGGKEEEEEDNDEKEHFGSITTQNFLYRWLTVPWKYCLPGAFQLGTLPFAPV